jgi:hypothetical protein
MKKLTLILLFMCLGVISTFAQAPQADPKNLNWTPGNNINPNGSRLDPDVFLQGTFVEIGIAAGGSCGSFAAIPGGYHAFAGRLGFVADYDQNGWAIGTPPQSGDYFVPGYPWEGWLCEFNDAAGGEYTFINCDATGQFGVPQTTLTNTTAGTTNSALWTGTAVGGSGSLLVEQNFYFDDADAKFFIEVTLTNSGPDPLTSVEYARAVDPDQEVDLGGDFITENWVAHQPDGSNNLAKVIGNGPDFEVPMALQINHPNAKAHVCPSSLDISTPDTPLDATFAPDFSSKYIADVGVAVAVRFPELAPGASETFTVVYLLNPREAGTVPLSNWAIALMVGLVVVFTIIRFRRMN